MAAAVVATAFPADFSAGSLHARHTNSSFRTDMGMFSKLKNKLTSGKGKAPSTAALRSLTPPPPPLPSPPRESKHFQTQTQSTRRPANPPTVSNPFQMPRGPAQPVNTNNPYNTSSEAPPAYSPAPNAAPTPQSRDAATSGASSELVDDPYAFLYDFDTIFIIDDSGSMTGSRWGETADALQAITPICTKHDADGIDIYFLNQKDSTFFKNVKNVATVREIFQSVRPSSTTPLGKRMREIVLPYIAEYKRRPDSTKPLNVICITDGQPSDDLESVLIEVANGLDKLQAPAWQVGVQFFQVGNDAAAKEYLQGLDDNLAAISRNPNMRDIVDTVPFMGAKGGQLNGDGILKVVLGAVNRRLDRKGSKDLHRS